MVTKKLICNGKIYIVPCMTKEEEKKQQIRAEKEHKNWLKTGKSALTIKPTDDIRSVLNAI